MITAAERIADVMSELAEANDALARAVAIGDLEGADGLMRRAARLEKQRNTLLRRVGAARPAQYATAIPMRDQVIRALRLGGRPISTRLLADLSHARYDDTIPTTKLASLRRDEANSWKAARTGGGRTAVRDVYVVPALTHDRFAPVRGTLVLSSWPLRDRIVAPASPRVDMLRVTVAVADECATARPDAPWLAPLKRLLTRLARTVPGIRPGGLDDPAAVREAAGAELDVLARTDAEERATAESRARERLDEYALLFGTTVTLHRGSIAQEA